MRLNDIAEVILENVEKLLPHLRDQVREYLALIDDIGGQKPSSFPTWANENSIKKWIDEAIEWALKSDPKYIKEIRKGKSLDKVKSPFVRHILRWWLDPRAGGGIELPEDIETTAEMLQKFNLAKQQGLNIDINSINSWDQFITALEPFLQDEEGDAEVGDKYTRMGLDIVFNEGPWKMYQVDKWIPGDKSTLHPGQVCHRAFEGTNWCVKYERTFTGSYSGMYYLVTLNGKRFGLINFPSLQFKNPLDKGIATTSLVEATDFISQLFSQKPEFLAELALGSIMQSFRTHKNFGDFGPLIGPFEGQIQEILKSPHAKTAALKNPKYTEKLAKIIGEWPYFEGWPEGKEAIINADFSRYSAVMKSMVESVGRIPELEAKLDPNGFKHYANWVGNSDITKGEAQELIDMGRDIAEKAVRDNPTELRSAVGWLTTERALSKGDMDPWPEMAQMILQTQNPRSAFAFTKLMGLERWPEAEPLIAADDRSAVRYEKLTGIDVRSSHSKGNLPADPRSLVNRAISRGSELEPKQEEEVLQDLNAAIDYSEHLIGPWPELENLLRSHGTPEQKNRYAKNVLYSDFQ